MEPQTHYQTAFSRSFGMSSSTPFPPFAPASDPRTELAVRWVAAHNNWDVEAMMSMTSADDNQFLYEYLPKSTGMGNKSLGEWTRYVRTMKRMLPDFSSSIINVFPTPGPTIFHLLGTATSQTGARFEQEYMILVYVGEESAASASISASRAPDNWRPRSFGGHPNETVPQPKLKVVRVSEFVDSRFASRFFPAERERRETIKAQQAAVRARSQPEDGPRSRSRSQSRFRPQEVQMQAASGSQHSSNGIAAAKL